MNVERGHTQVNIVHHTDHDGTLDTNKRKYINYLYYFTLAGIVVSVLLVLSILALEITNNSNNNSNQNSSNSSNPSIKIVSRKEWLAEPPKAVLEPLKLPVARVIIAHTVSGNCTTQSQCSQLVRNIQAHHIQMDYDDIGYNFLVGGDGAIYVGRGWDRVGAHTRGYNVNSICFAFIGDFDSIQPPEHQLIAAQKMIFEGVKLKMLRADYVLYGQRQFMETASPGKALFEIIKTWDHWSDGPVGPPNP